MRRRGQFISAARPTFQTKTEAVLAASPERANELQVRQFLGHYDASYRLSKMLSLRFVLQRRPEFAKELAAYYRDTSRSDDEAIYHRFTNGVMHAAAAELVMLREDFFSLMRFCREPLLFAKKMGKYQAGEMGQWLKRWESPFIPQSSNPEADQVRTQRASKLHRDRVRKALFLPTDEEVAAKFPDDVEEFAKAARVAEDAIHRAANDVRKWKFAYNSHKHGLKSALRWPGPMTDAAIAKRRSSLEGDIASFDTETIENDRPRSRPLMFTIDPELLPVSAELMKAGNFLRVFSETSGVDLEYLIWCARDVAAALLCLFGNRQQIGTDNAPQKWTVMTPLDPWDIKENDRAPMMMKFWTFDMPPPRDTKAYQLPELDKDDPALPRLEHFHQSRSKPGK